MTAINIEQDQFKIRVRLIDLLVKTTTTTKKIMCGFEFTGINSTGSDFALIETDLLCGFNSSVKHQCFSSRSECLDKEVLTKYLNQHLIFGKRQSGICVCKAIYVRVPSHGMMAPIVFKLCERACL